MGRAPLTVETEPASTRGRQGAWKWSRDTPCSTSKDGGTGPRDASESLSKLQARDSHRKSDRAELA